MRRANSLSEVMLAMAPGLRYEVQNERSQRRLVVQIHSTTRMKTVFVSVPLCDEDILCFVLKDEFVRLIMLELGMVVDRE